MDLNDLKVSLSDMTTEQLMELIRNVRTSRRTPKTTTNNKPRKASSAKESNPVSMEALLATASPEQIADLIKTLEGKQ